MVWINSCRAEKFLGAKAAKTGEKGADLCGRGNAIGAVEVVLGGAGRMYDVGSRHYARLAGQLPPFEARRRCFLLVLLGE